MFLVLFVVLLLLLPFAYDSSAKFRYYARFCVYYSYVTIASVLLIPFMAYRPKQVDNLLWASSVCRVVSSLIGLRWTVYGLDQLRDPSSCVIVANHQSSLDILGMFQIWHDMGRVTVVAKKELLYAGPFGLAAWLCDLIFIDRNDPAGAWEVISHAVDDMLPQKKKLWVFPEGTRRSTGSIHLFKRGAFHVAVANQIPIVPVVYSSYYFLDNKRKTFEPGEIVINVLPAIDTVGLKEGDVETLIENIRQMMVAKFESCAVPEPIHHV